MKKQKNDNTLSDWYWLISLINKNRSQRNNQSGTSYRGFTNKKTRVYSGLQVTLDNISSPQKKEKHSVEQLKPIAHSRLFSLFIVLRVCVQLVLCCLGMSDSCTDFIQAPLPLCRSRYSQFLTHTLCLCLSVLHSLCLPLPTVCYISLT